jgi:iron(III) transport system substrate-binding protein
MTRRTISRRHLLQGSALLAAGAITTPVRGALPEAEKITPALIEAAKKEGKLSWYTSVDLPVAERIGKAFETHYPGIKVKVERSGAERIYQRIGQENSSRINNCDVVNSSDAAHLIIWKRDGLLAPYLPEEVKQHFPANHYDADGMFATWRITLSPIAYNTKLVKAEEAPKGFNDLLDPKWAGKIVKAHPGYSGTIMTATQQLSRDLGWEFFERLAKQRVMQVQSAADPPKKLALGERAIMADGGEYVCTDLKARGEPIEVVYAVEGTPLITGPSAVFKAAPNPNAARLFHAWSMTAEAQQLNIDVGGLRSVHPAVKEREGRPPLKDIKLLREDAATVAKDAESIKERYVKLFKV